MDGSTSLLVKRAKYSVRKDLKLPGVLTVAVTQLYWTPHDPNQLQTVYVDLKAISDSLQRAKGKPLLRVPLPNGALVFEFETEVDRDQAVDVITPILQDVQRKGKGPAVPQQAPEGMQGPQAELKQRLLEQDRDLQQMYKQLVVAGVLSEAEFWKGRQNLLKQGLHGGQKKKQQPGFQTAMISEQATENGGRKVKVTLSPEALQQIFAEKPYIHRAFTALVPSKLSERDFWEKYFNFELAKKAKGSGGSAVETALEEDPFKDFIDEDSESKDAHRRLMHVDPAVNLTIDAFDRDAQPSDTDRLESQKIIRDINKHAAVVVEGRHSSGSQTAPVVSSNDVASHGPSPSGLDDLRKPWIATFSELRVRDAMHCYEGGEPKKAAKRERPAHEDALRAVEALCSGGLTSPLMDSAAAQQALAELGRQWDGTASQADALAAVSGGAEQNLPQQMQAVLRETVLTINELLRHFWSAFPLTSPARETRALRIKTALADQYDRTTAMQESSVGIERVHITQLLKPVRLALDTALAKHDREVSLKSAMKKITAMQPTHVQAS